MASSSDFIFLPSEDVMAGTKASRLKECDGSTCLAWHSINHEYGGRHLFIKQLRPELQEKEHCRLIFRKEFDIGSTLDSPYLPHYRSLKETASGMMMTMDFIEGKTLEQLLKDDPAYLRHARNLERILTQLAEALVYLHAHNVLHLDLKPSNIMLTQRTQNIVIIDLGFCSADAWLQSMGTNHNFSAPEQDAGLTDHISAHSDIYAAGRIIAHIAGETRAALPKWLRRIVEKCTEKEPALRYETAADLLEALRTHGRNKRRHRRMAAGAILALVIAAGIAAGLHWKRQIVEYYYDHTQERTFSSRIFRCHVMSFYDATVEIIAPEDSLYSGNLVIPDTVHYRGRAYDVVRIADKAFYGCRNLLSCMLCNGLRSIGDSAFYQCRQLTTVNMGDSLRELGVASYKMCDSLQDIRFSRNIREIPESCFRDEGRYFRRVELPEGLEVIGKDAFCGDRHLEKIILPQSLRTIKRGVFWECDRLDNVVIPAGVEEIGEFCFWYCLNLHSVTMKDRTPETCPDFIAYVKGDTDFYVPRGCLDVYRNTFPWSTYTLKESPE
ncbi:MAG: leucine-rich repeat protein [Bacteroidaceae bacterium]|nr:leucine-rich repeat protein [Bacteroidaceae bacterium]